MELNKIEKEGVTYFELFISCPICYDRGIVVNQAYAIHNECEGKMYAGDNGHYRCELCNLDAPAYYWEFECHCNSKSEFIPFTKTEQPKPDSTAINLSLVGQMVSITGILWLQNFLKNSDPENHH